jgi:hypothetical protein
MSTLTASQARALLPDYTFEEIQSLLKETDELTDKLSVKSHYLGYLCAKGDLDKIKRFILQNRAGELEEIVNHRPEKQWKGTCLHMVTYWNTGDKALEIFKLLVTHGAIFYEDGYGKFPWEITGVRWLDPITMSYLGERDMNEFTSTITDFCRMYRIDQAADATP